MDALQPQRDVQREDYSDEEENGADMADRGGRGSPREEPASGQPTHPQEPEMGNHGEVVQGGPGLGAPDLAPLPGRADGHE